MKDTTNIDWELVRSGVRKYLARLRIEKDDKDDIEQEAMLRAWKHRDGYRGDSKQDVWGFSIARNAHMTELTKEARIPPTGCLDECYLASTEDTPSEQEALDNYDLEAEALVVFVRSVMLPERIRLVVDREYHGMEYSSIALARGIPIGTVRSNLARARKTLHKKIAAIGLELGIDEAKKIFHRALELLNERVPTTNP